MSEQIPNLKIAGVLFTIGVGTNGEACAVPEIFRIAPNEKIPNRFLSVEDASEVFRTPGKYLVAEWLARWRSSLSDDDMDSVTNHLKAGIRPSLAVDQPRFL